VWFGSGFYVGRWGLKLFSMKIGQEWQVDEESMFQVLSMLTAAG
jgi:hypothetical protein